MNTLENLRKLEKIAQLMRDRDLSRLTLASAQKAGTQSLLSGLDKTQPTTGLDPVIAAQVVDRFGLWTMNRRILLNQQLARDTVKWLAAKADAQKSFGRAEVLGKLTKRR
ncbi:hypothetical protein [Pseudotabrizicola alkalilacus]|uniref:Uncharacterized protein n=1 Tax=Pseudotabrizicola alkalilacus TaxID=2305252 RepID=A0A411YX39_9RHOB|nr:hypothetical protein [Pseudotabrizicola alkalilacus]RGP35454.1 hypothetical protein D1012_19650 [Pseudotabrizicola alkalilacus]